MYAVVSTGGKQLKVEKGTIAIVEKLDAAIGEAVTLDVLFVADGDDIVVGSDAAAATVTVEIVEHFKGEKLLIFKFKKRKGYKRTKGHRQNLTKILVTDIATSGGAKKVSAKTAEPKAKVAAKPAKKAEPKAEVAAKPAKKAEPKAKVAKAAAVEVVADQCEALKADGERCTKKAKEGSKYCGVHAKKYDE
ncbi:MAG: 50S ribosomal protein L21 [Actinobacteria bacterium]|nr:50S ribosomal protein L21 [Actinomycetota bacterium]MCG2807514.1 50S ribosomal protein L21 [Coriobacteriia bacterium]